MLLFSLSRGRVSVQPLYFEHDRGEIVRTMLDFTWFYDTFCGTGIEHVFGMLV